MKKLFLFLSFSLFLCASAHALPLLGFYKTVDDRTGNAKAVVKLYECAGLMCGRIVALFDKTGSYIEETISNPVRVAEKLAEKPHLDGLDILWHMEWSERSQEFSGGRIMDPMDGRTYRARIWQDRNDPGLLNVRGMIGPFGRTQVWQNMEISALPEDLQNLDISDWEVVIRN
ncbi:MAG: DUF2147 domain-containing protein [Alphaproteobacteria bacterium]|nr:DUF2147 domain-containing protein [Alphaproteobacteria bacterium]